LRCLRTAFQTGDRVFERLFEKFFDVASRKFLYIRHPQAAELVTVAAKQTLWVVQLYTPHKSKDDAPRADCDRAKNVAHPVGRPPAECEKVVVVIDQLVAFRVEAPNPVA